ncbi:Hydrophobe/amphiphile efflux-1 HAE1 [Candidatus Koribacter versatilis Ellin345]|uniref:Hydrophobe/amphiphile efflux-1 HAE1 n=1 Tax=Koribacter versatilis (strain Ellin345) TaxID=204669 RepID=Q1IJ79_KORVE|nr:multidrug efflux RND transporter permease subunit [Candidatus Koribacter versatilis]ABF43071.1 Hydrophobe/amphiphile efflux-1 HAE1 [Candidatus Koribacter versatilis Ellin345]
MANFFIRRPIVAMVIAILMVIIGVVSMLRLPTAQFPDIAPPEVQVKATYPGADAETVEQAVATPIEQQMSGVDNMNYMFSTNANNGATTLTVNFDIKTDPSTDQILSQMRTNQANSQLPADVVNFGVTVQKSTMAPLMLITLYSPKGTYDNIFLANYSYINLNDQLTRVPGIASVTVFGAGQYAMRVWVKPDTLAKLSVTVPEIIKVIQAQNTVNPAGQIGGEPVPQGQDFTYNVRAKGRLPSAEEFEQIVVRANPDGSILRLKDVARIELGAQNYNIIGRYSGKPAAVVAVYQLPGSNAVKAAAGVRALMEEAKTRFPQDLDYDIALDTTVAVTEGLKEIQHTLAEAIVLVILVVYIFLQGWRTTLIPLLAVPVSLVGTFVVFPLLGFSINTLSLFGLVLAIGIVVDDAIVVVEAVEHHIEHGLSPKDAAYKAMEEVSGPVVAIALILAAVFVPTAFIPGITGRLYQQFAITIAISVIFSAFNALSLSPALAALLLKPKKEARGPLGAFFRWFNKWFGRATDGYVSICGGMIRKAALSMILLAGLTVLAGWFGKNLPKSFLPDEDQGYVFAGLQLPNAASLQRNSDAAKKIEEMILKTPGVHSVTTVAGYSMLSGVQATYSTFFWITLKEWSERKTPEESYEGIKKHLNKELASVTEGVAFSFPPPAIPGVGASGGFTFLLEDRAGKDVAFLSQNLQKFMAAARKRPEIAGISTTALLSVPQVYVDVDRPRVIAQGVQLNDVYRTMQTFMGGTLVNYFNRFGRQWQVYVQAEGDYRTKAENVGQFYVNNNDGQSVPLSAVTSIKRTSGPEFTMRYNLYRCVQINGNAAPGYSSEQAIQALEETFKESMPSEMGFDYMGMSYQEKKAAEGVPASAIFGMSLLFVFLILAAQYESWSLPFSVLLGTPIAVAGAFAFLYFRGMENNIYVQIGLVMLIGLAAKNAILIVEFAKMEYDKGKSAEEAALIAAKLRLRPILMTAFAFILGCVPLWAASGAGAISRRVLGTAVIGGMMAASLLAIFLIPVSFDVVERLSHMGGSKHPPSNEGAETTVAGGGH